MFESLKGRWKEARAQVLRKEAEDAMMRIRALPQEVNSRAVVSLATAHQVLVNEAGPIENISNQGKTKLSKILTAKAREAFEMDMGRGYGLAILSMYLEASCLPGKDAQFVHETTKGLLDAALQVVAGMDQALAERKGS